MELTEATLPVVQSLATFGVVLVFAALLLYGVRRAKRKREHSAFMDDPRMTRPRAESEKA